MSENTDLMQRGYDAFAHGDMETIRSIWTDDFEWQATDYEPVPGSGVIRGPDAVFQMFGELGQYWDEFRVVPDEFIEQGDTVVVLGHNEARANSGGEQIKIPFVHVWRMSDGKARRVQVLADTAVAAKALRV